MFRRLVLICVLIVPGTALAAAFGWYAIKDWHQLQIDYRHYQSVAAGSADIRVLFAAYAAQAVHRTNLFAEGVWALLSVIWAGLGVHGLCVMNTKG